MAVARGSCAHLLHAVELSLGWTVALLTCRFSAGANANILWSAGVRDRSEVTVAINRLQAAGMPTIDISGMDSARVSQVAGSICVLKHCLVLPGREWCWL
jgi:hypothetical protein